MKMKRWIYSILISFLLLLALPPAEAAAASGELSVKNQDVFVAFHIPEAGTEAVTALRFQMKISVSTGTIGQPTFQFAHTVPSSVKDVLVSASDSGYVVDVILAGKKEQDIFSGGKKTVIGTLSLHPTTQSFRATVEIAGEASDTEPMVNYVSSTGQSMQSVTLSGLGAAVVTDAAGTGESGSSGNGGAGESGNKEKEEDKSENPGEVSSPFQKNDVPKLDLSVEAGTRWVNFSWNRIAGADGYQIFEYHTKTGKHTRLKTIFQPNIVNYSARMEYGTTYAFRLRAFKTEADGSRTYGRLSAIMGITTAPEKVTGLSVKRQTSQKVTLTWKRSAHAEGYQIYRSTKKNGKYTRIKTIYKGTANRRSNISQKGGVTYYYKVRAYVVQLDGTRQYGKFSAIRLFKLP